MSFGRCVSAQIAYMSVTTNLHLQTRYGQGARSTAIKGAAPRKKANGPAAILPILIGTRFRSRSLFAAKMIATGSRFVFFRDQSALPPRPVLRRNFLPRLRLSFSGTMCGYHARSCQGKEEFAKKRAVVAVARKLAVLLLSLWKHQRPYQPFPLAGSRLNLQQTKEDRRFGTIAVHRLEAL
jgi:hypothetical protein